MTGIVKSGMFRKLASKEVIKKRQFLHYSHFTLEELLLMKGKGYVLPSRYGPFDTTVTLFFPSCVRAAD